MALDRPDDDFDAADVRPEQDARTGPAGGDVPARRAEPAETRSHDEYYEVLRAADGGTSDEADAADSGDDRSGWDSVDAADRPPVEAIRVTPDRRTHILDGEPDGDGGGHRHGTGKPGKTEFPASWDDEKVIDTIVDVARRPDMPPQHQQRNDRLVARGTREDVEIVAIIERDGRIWTSWPLPGGPGVVKNPKEK
jgi:hypothetical protein